MLNRKSVCGIYKIESPSGRLYVGSSVNIKRRLRVHKRELRDGVHINEILQRAANKYGVDALVFDEYACVLDPKDVRLVEQQIIDDLRPEYNISKVADCALFDAAVVNKRVAALSKAVVRLTDGAVFSSGYEAARAHQIKSPDNLSTAIKNGWKFAGHFWKFVGDPQTLEQASAKWNAAEQARKDKAANGACKARGKPVRRLLDGLVFPSAQKASLALGGHRQAVWEAITRQKIFGGSRWEYV